MPRHYLAVLVPIVERGWRAHLPDFPGCGADGNLVEQSLAEARVAARHAADQLAAQGIPLPERRSYEAVRSHTAWANERGIDWDNAVICVLDLKLDE